MNTRKMILSAFSIVMIIFMSLITACSKAEPERKYKIAIINPAPVYQKIIKGLMAEIESSELKGHIDFIIYDYGTNPKDYEDFARKAEEMEVDIIYTISTPVTKAAMSTVNNIFIVFNAVGDPAGAGIVNNYIKPGGNITGTTHLSRELTAKRLELFNLAIPNIKNLVTFYDPSNKFSQLAITDLREAARRLKLNITEITAVTTDELSNKIKNIKKPEAEGIFIIPDPIVLQITPKIIELSNSIKAPIVAHEVDFVQHGAAISYGADFFELGRLSYFHIKAILEGSKAGNLPVLTADSFELAVNLTVIRQMGRHISEEMLFFANWIY